MIILIQKIAKRAVYPTSFQSKSSYSSATDSGAQIGSFDIFLVGVSAGICVHSVQISSEVQSITEYDVEISIHKGSFGLIHVPSLKEMHLTSRVMESGELKGMGLRRT